MNASLLKPYLFSIFAIVMWGSLAALGVKLSFLPPFLLTGAGLIIGSVVGLVLSKGRIQEWKVPWSTLVLGVMGLFGFHFLLFMSLRLAPPIQANLVNYLWPLCIVILAPIFLPNTRLHIQHVLAGVLGFSGAALAIYQGADTSAEHVHAYDMAWLGYLLAVGSCLTWAGYSLLSKRVRPFPTSAIGLFGLVSGLLSLMCSWFFEDWVFEPMKMEDWLHLLLIGIGPLGAAFYAWDAAIKQADTQRVGVLAFFTPLLSTLVLAWSQGYTPDHWLWLAATLIVLACMIAARAPKINST